MANVILNFNSNNTTQETTNPDVVYSDVSLKSKTAKTYFDKEPHFVVSKSLNVKAVENAIENIFNHIPGERILYPEFGTGLRAKLYEGITPYNIEEVIAQIKTDILKFDSRILIDRIEDISSVEEVDDNTINLRIFFHIQNLPDKLYSYVYSYVRAIE
jgi:phage baseplate assembly protein W